MVIIDNSYPHFLDVFLSGSPHEGNVRVYGR